MARESAFQLPFAKWPAADRGAWEAAFKAGDRFDESGPGAHLAESTRKVWRESYARFLGFISATHRSSLDQPPDRRINPIIVAEYVAWRRRCRRSCEDMTVAIDLDHLRGALRLICRDTDWSWLLTITKRMAAKAPRRTARYHLVTSERLYALGVELMDRAVAAADAAGHTSKEHAFAYRDGMIIALLALIPIRRRTLVALRIGRQLVKTGGLWALDIPAGDTKSGRPLDYPISKELSERIDTYLVRFRCRIPGADRHTSAWASNQGRPLCAGAIYDAVCRRTKKAFGFGVSIHRFRHAAATFWSIQDPANVRGAKDLLGQASFSTTEGHYIMAQSRLAGRALRQAVDRVLE